LSNPELGANGLLNVGNSTSLVAVLPSISGTKRLDLLKSDLNACFPLLEKYRKHTTTKAANTTTTTTTVVVPLSLEEGISLLVAWQPPYVTGLLPVTHMFTLMSQFG
jgi:hypothetical protein